MTRPRISTPAAPFETLTRAPGVPGAVGVPKDALNRAEPKRACAWAAAVVVAADTLLPELCPPLKATEQPQSTTQSHTPASSGPAVRS